MDSRFPDELSARPDEIAELPDVKTNISVVGTLVVTEIYSEDGLVLRQYQNVRAVARMVLAYQQALKIIRSGGETHRA